MRPSFRRGRRRRRRRAYEWSASHTHPIEWEVRRPWWPPFYATALFLPRVKVRLVNMGARVDRCGLSAEVLEYDGPIGTVSAQTEGWIDTFHHEWHNEPWNPAKTRKLTIPVRSRNLPRAGTYVLRIRLTEWIPQDSPYNELKRGIERWGSNVGEAQIEEILKQMREMGIDPYARQPNSYRGEQMFEGTIIDYLRVEDVSSVFNFFLVIGTLLTAFATLALAITT